MRIYLREKQEEPIGSGLRKWSVGFYQMKNVGEDRAKGWTDAGIAAFVTEAEQQEGKIPEPAPTRKHEPDPKPAPEPEDTGLILDDMVQPEEDEDNG